MFQQILPEWLPHNGPTRTNHCRILSALFTLFSPELTWEVGGLGQGQHSAPAPRLHVQIAHS